MRAKLRQLSPNDHEEIWNKLKHPIEPLLVGRFELSTTSLDVPLRKVFHHMLIHMEDLPQPLIRAVGGFLSCLLNRIDNELPTTRLIARVLAEPTQISTPPGTSGPDKAQLIYLLNQQHTAILSTLSKLTHVTINWTALPTSALKSTLSAQTRNMLDSFLLSIDNRLHDHIFRMKALLSAAININGSCLSAIISSGIKTRKEFEALLTSLTHEDDNHFAMKKQLQDLLIDFRRVAGLTTGTDNVRSSN